MQIGIHKGFLESLDALNKEDRRRTRETLSKLQSQPASHGLRWHPVMNGFVSLSPTMGVRIIAQQSDQRLLLLHVDQHDAAYTWAKRHALLSDVSSDVLELIILPETLSEQAVDSLSSPVSYGHQLRQQLLANHIPAHIASTFGNCPNEDELLVRIQSMSPEWQEVILKIATGQKAELSEIPTTSSSIRVLAHDLELSDALALPLSSWKLFLHPRQQEVVENRADRFVTVIGGPGTGKSVVCAHRAVSLADQMALDEVSIVFTFSQGLADDLRNLVNDLRPNQNLCGMNQRTFLRKTWVFGLNTGRGGGPESLPVSIRNNQVVMHFQGQTRKVRAITVDEFQDCPIWFVNFLATVVAKTTCEFITVALDAQQTIFKMDNTESIKQFIKSARRIVLPFSYRMSRQLLEHSYSVLSRYAPEYMDYLDLGQGVQLPLATISGPHVRYICAPNLDILAHEAKGAIQRLEQNYDDHSVLALVHLQYWAPYFHQKGKTDPIAEALQADETLAKYYQFGFWTKGKEYFAGVVVCPSNFMPRDLGRDNVLRLNTMFVTLTRFREDLTIIYQPDSPVARYLAVD